MCIQNNIGIFFFLHEIFPRHQFEAVVNDHIFVFRHIFTDAVIGIKIIFPEKIHRDRCRTLCKNRVCRWITMFDIHSFPHIFCDRLVKRLDSQKTFPCSIALREAFQYAECKLNFIRILCPFADSADSTVIKTILAHWNGMKIDQDRQTIFFCPVKSFIQFFDASDKWFSVAKDKIRYRDSHGLKSHSFDRYKITLCDVFGTMDLDSCFIYFRRELARKIILIFRCCAFK